MKKILSGLWVMPAMVLAASVAAADAGPYIGGFIGKAEVNELNDSSGPGVSVDDSDTSYKFLVGHRVNDNFAVEGFYNDHGEYSVELPSALFVYDISSVGVAALAIASVSPSVELHGKLGLHAWDADVQRNNTVAADSDDGSDFIFGVGMSYREGPVSLRVDLERYDYDTDVDTASLGLIYHF